MVSDIREKGREALEHVPEKYLPAVVRFLELVAEDNPDIEPGKLWSLAVETEDEADSRIMTESLGPYMDEDGNVDFDALRADCESTSLAELFPEFSDDE